MSDTPRTDVSAEMVANLYNELVCSPRTACVEAVNADFARQLERELNEAKRELSAITAELALSKVNDDDSNLTAIGNLTRAASECDSLKAQLFEANAKDSLMVEYVAELRKERQELRALAKELAATVSLCNSGRYPETAKSALAKARAVGLIE
jgi:hypothetical protein